MTNMSKRVIGAQFARRAGLEQSARKLGGPGIDRLKSLRDPQGLRLSLADSAVYWHSELPPLDAEPMGEHTIEAASVRVPHTLSRADELWNRCYEDLMLKARNRLEQEIVRLEGNYAHVLEEHVESKYDGATGESWLRGLFRYVLYRKPTDSARAPSTGRAGAESQS